MAEMSKRLTWMGEYHGVNFFIDPDLPRDNMFLFAYRPGSQTGVVRHLPAHDFQDMDFAIFDFSAAMREQGYEKEHLQARMNIDDYGFFRDLLQNKINVLHIMQERSTGTPTDRDFEHG